MTNPNTDETVAQLRPRTRDERLAAWKARRKEATRLAWCEIVANEPLGILCTPDEEVPLTRSFDG